jgi:hypothetical protein
MRTLSSALGLLLLFTSACDGTGPTSPPTSFPEVLYRTSGTDQAVGATRLANGHLAVYGLTEGRIAPADGTNAYPLVLRLQPDGSIPAATAYRDGGYGRVTGAVALGDGLAVLTMTREVDGAGRGAPKLTLYRTDADGGRTEVLYTRSNTSAPDHSLHRAPDGGLLLVTFPFDDAASDLVKIDGPGSMAWTYQMPGVQDVRAVEIAPDGDVFVLGAVDAYRFAIARLTPAGNERWRRTYGDERVVRQLKGIATVNDGVAVLMDRLDNGSRTVHLTRFSATGDVQWDRSYATGTVHATALAALGDDKLAVAWTEDTTPANIGGHRARIVHLSRQGDVQSSYPFGPQEEATTTVSGLLPYMDGSFVAVGATGPERLGGFGGDDFDVLITRFTDAP